MLSANGENPVECCQLTYLMSVVNVSLYQSASTPYLAFSHTCKNVLKFRILRLLFPRFSLQPYLWGCEINNCPSTVIREGKTPMLGSVITLTLICSQRCNATNQLGASCTMHTFLVFSGCQAATHSSAKGAKSPRTRKPLPYLPLTI